MNNAYLNNQITIWENLYGDAYTYCYNEQGHIREDVSLDDPMFSCLKMDLTVLQVLRKIKKYGNRPVKRVEKRRYKIER